MAATHHVTQFEQAIQPVNSTAPSLVNDGRHVLAVYRDNWDQQAPATEFVLKGILAETLNVMGASHGVGKTTLLVKLALHVIDAFPKFPVAGGYANGILQQSFPRHVVHLSEHPEQVEQIAQALILARGADKRIVKERLHVVRTKRLSVDDIVNVADWYRDELTETVERNGVRVKIMPWVIIDTMSATIDLESEQDNSEVGKAIAKLKETFADIPVTIVAHVAKAIKYGDSKTMSIRGASAFGADSNQETFVTIDEKTGNRFFEYGSAFIKHRFKADGEAFKMVYQFQPVKTVNRWGEIQEEEVGFVDLVPVTNQERAEMADEARASEEEAFRQHVLATIHRLGAKHSAVTKIDVINAITARKQRKNDVINHLAQTDQSIDMVKAESVPDLYERLTGKSILGNAKKADILIINGGASGD